jgi:hypothetical protein
MRRSPYALLLLGCVAALPPACVDVFRGAIVQTNFTVLPSNIEGEHYTLWASVNEGAVSLAHFKVLDAVDHRPEGSLADTCAGNPLTTPDVQLVQRWEADYDRVRTCGFAERIGTVDKVDVPSATLAGGVRWDVDVDLSDATNLFLTREPDDDLDPTPSGVVARADLGRARDPYEAKRLACLETYCDATPEAQRPTPDPCDGLGLRAPDRRGVRVGTWLAEPVTAVCAERPLGEVAVVPAEDETLF